MSVRISNQDVGIKINNVKSNTLNADTTKISTQKESWEFFKHIQGFVTGYLNTQINIPSTAFTPNFVLPTKDFISNILIVIDIFNQLKNKMELISNVFNSNNQNSNYNKRKEYITKILNQNLGRWQ